MSVQRTETVRRIVLRFPSGNYAEVWEQRPMSKENARRAEEINRRVRRSGREVWRQSKKLHQSADTKWFKS